VLIARQPVVETYFREQFLQSRIFAPVQACACELSHIEQDNTSSDAGFRPADEGTYTPAAFPNQGAPATVRMGRELAGSQAITLIEAVCAFAPFGTQPTSTLSLTCRFPPRNICCQ
jgi:hypothetical protein